MLTHLLVVCELSLVYFSSGSGVSLKTGRTTKISTVHYQRYPERHDDLGMFTVPYYGDVRLIGRALDEHGTPVHRPSTFVPRPFNGDGTGMETSYSPINPEQVAAGGAPKSTHVHAPKKTGSSPIRLAQHERSAEIERIAFPARCRFWCPRQHERFSSVESSCNASGNKRCVE